MTDVIEVSGVNAFYDKAQALFDVSFTVEDGSLHAILGRNGAGKTSLFRSIMNAGVRKTGTVKFNGADITGERCFRIARRGLQMVPEARAIIGSLTVVQNIGLARHAASGAREAIDMDMIVDTFPTLRPLLQRGGSQLSGGQVKLVSLARAFVADPTCMLIDEPFEGISRGVAAILGDAIVSMARDVGKTVVVAGQKLSGLVELADRVMIVADGHIVYDKRGEQFRGEQAELEKRYLAV